MAVTLNASSTAGFVTTADTSTILQLQTNGTTAVTVDASQNVTLVGTLTTSSRGIAKASMPTGSVLQVVQVSYATSVTTTSTAMVDTGLTASITPTSASSKIAVIVSQTLSPTTGGSSTFGQWQALRGGTVIYQDTRINMYLQFAHGTYSCALLDSPATTASVTYKTQMATGNASYTLEAQHAGLRTSTIMLMEIAA